MAESVHLPDLAESGRSALFEGEPHTVRLALDAGEEIPPHQHPDRDIVLYLCSGKLDLHLGTETVDVAAGDAVRFDGNQDISPRAREDSVALLVLAPTVD
jgi:quercetin dioxygenase-like cupin family protein